MVNAMALERFISTNNIIAENIYCYLKVMIFIDQRWCYDVPNLQPAIEKIKIIERSHEKIKIYQLFWILSSRY